MATERGDQHDFLQAKPDSSHLGTFPTKTSQQATAPMQRTT